MSNLELQLIQHSTKASNLLHDEAFILPLLIAMAAKSVEIYLQALAFVRKCGALLGVDSFALNYKPLNCLSFLLVFDAVTYTMVTVYCCFEFFGDLEKFIFCLVTYGFAIQVKCVN